MKRSLSLALLLALALAGAARAEEIQVIMAGKAPRSVEAYRAGPALYLDSGQAGALFRAQTYWRPMSGTVLFTLNGRRILFSVNSEQAQVGDKPFSLAHPVIVRTGQALIPLDFFSSDEFSGISGYESKFHPESKVLTIDRTVSVGPVQWFSFADRAQVVVGLRAGLAYSVTRRGRSGVQISVPLGRANAASRVAVNDGLIRTIDLKQEPELDPKIVKVVVELERSGSLWEQSEETSPRRVVLNVFKNQRAQEAFHKTPPVVVARPAVAETKEAAPAPFTPVGAPPTKVSDASAPVEEKSNEPALPPPGVMHKPRIVVDAGHGGKDKGTTGVHRTYEKDINLRAALDLAERLRKSGRFEVLLTRDNDTFVQLSKRSKAANDFRADLFVSLHCNSTNHRRESGFEIYFLSEKASDPESQRVADVENAVLALEGKSAEQESAAMLLQAMAKTEFMNDAAELAGLMTKQLPKRVDLKDRGVKQAAFYVLRGTNAPAVLVEMGYLSNSGDEARLANKKFRKQMVEGLYAGILDFSKRHGWRLEE